MFSILVSVLYVASFLHGFVLDCNKPNWYPFAFSLKPFASWRHLLLVMMCPSQLTCRLMTTAFFHLVFYQDPVMLYSFHPFVCDHISKQPVLGVAHVPNAPSEAIGLLSALESHDWDVLDVVSATWHCVHPRYHNWVWQFRGNVASSALTICIRHTRVSGFEAMHIFI